MILLAEAIRCCRSRPGSPSESVDGVSLRLEPGSVTVVTGGHGCGSGLLARVLGLMEVADEGRLLVDKIPVDQMEPDVRAAVRSQHFGFVFEEPYLLPSFSVVENVAMPLFKIFATNTNDARARVEELLEEIGIFHLAEEPVENLTSLEQMKVALARALVNRPHFLILAGIDESLAAAEIDAYLELARRHSGDAALVVAVDSMVLPVPGYRMIKMAEGRIISDSGSNGITA